MPTATHATGATPLESGLRDRLSPLLDYLEALAPGERADPVELRRRVAALDALRFADLEPLAWFSDGGYTRVRLAGNEMFEVLLMGWKPGQQSPIHDHARSVCAVRVLTGTASETSFEFTPSGNLRAAATSTLQPGQLVVSQDADVHLVANYETSKLCTLHVYSPPLRNMTQYRFDSRERADYSPEAVGVDSLTAALSGPPGRSGTIYLNNAATTWPKPEVVYEAVNRAMRATGSLGRTAGTNVETPLEAARARIAAFLEIDDPRRLAFVPGCTWACNIAIQNIDWHPGDRILMSGLEHSAVSRPVRLVAGKHGLDYACAPYSPGNPLDLDWVEDQLKRGDVRLVATLMASNVTGEILPFQELRSLTRRYGAMLMLDAAQAGGVLPLSIAELEPDLCVFAGHKGFYGPTGVGLLYVAPGLGQRLFVVGGTGRDSGKIEMSPRMPEQFEVGTHNGMALAGLEAGIGWLESIGTDQVLAHEQALARRFIEGLSARSDVQIYGDRNAARQVGVVSVRFVGRDPRQVGGWLAEHGIVTRAGFHCAPLAHRTIGSHAHGGTVRFSFGWSNTADDVDGVLAVLDQLDTAIACDRRPVAVN